jgi:glycosyltransferase involved in cell wall biosynthesis
MHVLMISFPGEEVQPGQDDVCQVLETARSLVASGISATVAIGRHHVTGLPAAYLKGQRTAMGVSPGRASLDMIAVPRLGVIPIRRAAGMPLAVLLQGGLSALAETMAGRERGQSFDLVHCFGWRAGPAAGLLARKMGLPLVVSLRDASDGRSAWLKEPIEAYRRYVRRWLLLRSQAVICPDERQAEKIIELYLVGEQKVDVMPSSDSAHTGAAPFIPGKTSVIDCQRNDPGQVEERRVLYHGPYRLTAGLKKLLQAIVSIGRRPSVSLRLFLAGPAGRPNRMAISGCIRRLGLADRITCLEPRTEPGWWDTILSVMDLMVLTDPVPFIGNLVWKAMGRGCPLLICWKSPVAAWLRARGMEEAVWRTGHEGGDFYLRKALFDGELRRRLSTAGKNLAMSVRPIGERLDELYGRICGKGEAEAPKGGEHRDVRIAENGGDGDIR